MRTNHLRFIALALAATGAHAQGIYRCGDSYSQQPCAGGQPVTAAPPAPAEAERARSLAATRRDAALAGSMEKDRLRQEAQAPSVYIPPPKFESPPEPHRWPEKAGTRKLDVFTAVAPGSVPPKKKPEPHAKKAKAKKPVATAKPGPQKTPAAGELASR